MSELVSDNELEKACICIPSHFNWKYGQEYHINTYYKEGQ